MISPASTINSNARANRKSPTKTDASFPHTKFAVSRPRRKFDSSITSSCSNVAEWINSTAVASPMTASFLEPVFRMILAPARVIIGRIRFPPAAIKCPASSGISGTSLDSLFIIISLTARISSASRFTHGSSETVLDQALDRALFLGTDIALITFVQSLLFHRGESNKRSLFSDQFLQHLRHYCASGRKCVLFRACHTPLGFCLLR